MPRHATIQVQEQAGTTCLANASLSSIEGNTRRVVFVIVYQACSERQQRQYQEEARYHDQAFVVPVPIA